MKEIIIIFNKQSNYTIDLEKIQMKKRIICIFLSFIMALSATNPICVMASEATTYAWPGRPGGNGDGSEEWLQGEYGETNGPYKLIYQKSGLVTELTKSSKLDIIGGGILGAMIASVDPMISAVVTVNGICAALKANQYSGAYYKLDAYVSGRRMRIVINTYKDEACTVYVNTYAEEVVW